MCAFSQRQQNNPSFRKIMCVFSQRQEENPHVMFRKDQNPDGW